MAIRGSTVLLTAPNLAPEAQQLLQDAGLRTEFMTDAVAEHALALMRADISVCLSRLAPGARQWSAPQQLSDDPDRAEQNPVLFPAPNGQLWLLHTAQTSGHQDTALVRVRRSADHGHTWGPVETLADAPAGTFVRQPVYVHRDGSWLLPIFNCRAAAGQVGMAAWAACK